MLACGASSSGIARRLANGKLQAVHTRVYRVTGFGRTWEQSLMAACLAAGTGSAVSHRAAATCWGLEGLSDEVVEVSTGRHRYSPPGSEVVVHATRLPKCDVCCLGPLPITTVTRTMIDLAGVVDGVRLEVALDDALRTRRTTLDRLAHGWANSGGRDVPAPANSASCSKSATPPPPGPRVSWSPGCSVSSSAARCRGRNRSM